MSSNFYHLARPRPRGGRLTAVDLFSGAGGLSLGLANSGFDVVFCSDRDGACAATHARNMPEIPFGHADVEDLSGGKILAEIGLKPGELDLLIGGPPCQGFSIIGQREVWDPRNGLFLHFLRIAAELRPRCVVIENVPGLATLAHGKVLNEIGRAFSDAGYAVECAELLAAQYGVPQMRWRMFFIGWRLDQGRSGGFPAPTHGRAGIGDLVPNRTISQEDMNGFLTIGEAISDLPAIGAGEVSTVYDGPPQSEFQSAMRAGTEKLHNHYAARLSKQNLARISCLNPGQDWRDLPHALLPPGMQRALRKDHTRRYRRMHWDSVARSIITRFRDPKSGEYTHPAQHRTISIREAARIQSFPDWFEFEGSYSQQYDQVGNAVPPLLGRAVAEELRRILEEPAGERRAPVKSRYRMPAPHLFAAE
ncbi:MULTISPECIES: DNA cytosine methyltransferase [unclassified Inquilinus]|uniref:DNA cytosine methyltransferase n=1 Tax=unclassified Inquilinus TaxID=2645927 RepID=UPI003F8E70B7